MQCTNRAVVGLGIVLSLGSATGYADRGAEPPAAAPQSAALQTVAPYIAAGDKLSTTYRGHVEHLKNFYQALKSRLESEAPELLKRLSPEPPKVTEPGYQYLPKITEVAVAQEIPKERLKVSVFSWVKTSEWLDGEMKTLAELEKALAAAKPAPGLHSQLETTIDQYRKLDSNQRIINSQIEYNRLWQSQIVQFPAKYKENTDLLEDLKSQKTTPEAVVEKTIHQLMAQPGPAITIKKFTKNHYRIVVDMNTDIEDPKFIATFKRAVEKFWQVDGPIKYDVRLKVKRLSPRDLYQPEPPPKVGEKIDLERHIGHFPKGPAILTTGAGTLHYSVTLGRSYVVLGTMDVTEVVAAHEFGHLLQLNDAYFRASRDIGENGYEIIEVIPDLTDIMSAPGLGRVKKHHFEIVAEALKHRP